MPALSGTGPAPVYLSRHKPEDVAALAEQVATRPVAIGEIGLDWFVPDLDRDRQQRLLEDQLRLRSRSICPSCCMCARHMTPCSTR